VEIAMLDFDNIDDWTPKLAEALRDHVPWSAVHKLQAAKPQYIEDARDQLLELTNRDAVIDAMLAWIRSTTIAGYHGTRLTDAETAAIRTMGIVPLKAENRRDRLVRALSPHPRWHEVSDRLDEVIQAHGKGARAGRREGRVDLTVSRSGLVNGFNHYLTHGAEFDQHVVQELLGPEGKKWLTRDGEARVIQVSVPGHVALDSAHPSFKTEDLRKRGDIPNLVKEFLNAWSYRLAHPTFQAGTLKVDCGMVFYSTVPSDWIMRVETLPEVKG
jgi:hypothetical protein